MIVYSYLVIVSFYVDLKKKKKKTERGRLDLYKICFEKELDIPNVYKESRNNTVLLNVVDVLYVE